MNRKHKLIKFSIIFLLPQTEKLATGESVIPYHGFSFYTIKSMSELPESIDIAHKNMSDLWGEVPWEILKNESIASRS